MNYEFLNANKLQESRRDKISSRKQLSRLESVGKLSNDGKLISEEVAETGTVNILFHYNCFQINIIIVNLLLICRSVVNDAS